MRYSDAAILTSIVELGGAGNYWQVCAVSGYAGYDFVFRLKNLGLLDHPHHGTWVINDKGKIALALWNGKAKRSKCP
jgi:hypothetical protein